MILLIIILLGCGVIGLVYLIVFFKIAYYRHQQKNWVKTYARIEDHRILRKWYHIYRVGTRRFCVILKEYEYEMNGTVYVRREELKPMLEVSAITKLNLTPIGSTVEIFYNPQNPGESTMEPGINSWHYNYLLLGLLWSIPAGFLLFDLIYS